MSIQEDVRTQIKSKLDGVTGTGKKLAVCYDEIRENPANYPAGMFEQIGEEHDFWTTGENLHKLTFRILVICESEAVEGRDNAIRIVNNAVQDVYEAFDKDTTNLGGYVDYLEPAKIRFFWYDSGDSTARVGEITLTVVKQVSFK